MEDIAQIQTYLANQKDVVLAYLFGSRAANRSAPESDYDIAILAQPALSPARRYQLASELASLLHGKPIDLLPLNQAPVELAYAVVGWGRRLIERDIAARVEFEADVLSRYGDAVGMLREQRADLLQSGGRYEAGIRRNRAALKQAERVLAEIRAAAQSRTR